MNLSLMKKIRCRVLVRSTGKPVSGVVATLSVAIGDGANAVRLPVATLCSDATGYLSFDLKPLVDGGVGDASGFFISAPGSGLAHHDLLGSLVPATRADTGAGAGRSGATAADHVGRMMLHADTSTGGARELPAIVFPIYVEPRPPGESDHDDAGCAPARLPAIQSPDIHDYQVSPFSFVSPTAVKLGDDCCETLVPTSLPVQQYRFTKVVVRRDEVNGRVDLPVREVRITDALETRAPVLLFGEVLDYRQQWYSLGHSLGEIKYSLPLAPGESTQVAVIDWSRDDRASRTDDIHATEFLDHDSRRDRSIEEAVEAALREEQGGNSHMGSTSGTASGSQYVNWTGNHAFGGAISYSYGNRDVEGDTQQDLHDRVRQASSFVRSLTSTVIVQGSQAEKSTLQSRRVANHNHCHALTIQYYEVLRHYRLSTAFIGRREAVLIPFALFKLDSWELALRFRTVIEQALLDPSLATCFEALIRLHLAPSVYDAPKPPKPPVATGGVPGPTGAAPAARPVETSVRVRGSEGQGVASKVTLRKGDAFTMRASGTLAVSGGNGYGSFGFPPSGDGTVAPDHLPGAAHLKFLAPGLAAFSLIYKIGRADAWHQVESGAALTAHRDGEIVFGVNNVSNGFADFGSDAWTVDIEHPAHEAEVPAATVPGTTGPAAAASKDASVVLKGSEGQGKATRITVRTNDKITMRASGSLAMSGGNGYGSFGFPPTGDNTVAPDHLAGSPHLKFLAPGLLAFSMIYKIGRTDAWHQVESGVVVTAHRDGEIIFGVNNVSNGFADFRPESWRVDVEYPLHDGDAPTPTDPSTKGPAVADTSGFSRSDDQLCAARLLTHLKNNQGFYNGAVWMLMNGVERRLYLEAALHDQPDILFGIEDRPLALSGNYVAFPFANPSAPSVSARDPSRVPVEDIVTLPTRGLFAEAQLGHCNSCEKRDVTRMWDWTEMTAETPPEIGGITPGPKGLAPTIAPGQLPGNVIQIVQPQAAPDPTGLAQAMGVLKTPSIFRDMAGLDEVSKLLGELVKAAGDANSKQLAQQAKSKIDGMNQNQTPEADAADAAEAGDAREPSGISAADAADRFSLLPEIKNFAKDLNLDDEQTQQLALDHVYGTKPSGKTPPKASTTAKPIKLHIEGRVTRDGKLTQEPVSGILDLLMSRVIVADKQEGAVAVTFDIIQGVGGNVAWLVPGERYMIRPKITMSGDAIANRLDEAMAAARFEVPGLDLESLTSRIGTSIGKPRVLDGTGFNLIAPTTKSMVLELQANVESLPNYSTEITLDGLLGFKGTYGAQATFDPNKITDLVDVVAAKLKTAEAKFIGAAISGVLNMFTIKLDLNNQSTASGEVTIGSKLIFIPQVLRSIAVHPQP